MRKNFFQSGEISTISTIGMLLFLGVTALSSSLILKNKTSTSPRAANTLRCQDNPETPPSGYYWKADCSKSCHDKSACQQNTTDPSNVNPGTSSWCYGFVGSTGTWDDWRCMMLLKNGDPRIGTPNTGSSNPQPTSTTASVQPTSTPVQREGQPTAISTQRRVEPTIVPTQRESQPTATPTQRNDTSTATPIPDSAAQPAVKTIELSGNNISAVADNAKGKLQEAGFYIYDEAGKLKKKIDNLVAKVNSDGSFSFDAGNILDEVGTYTYQAYIKVQGVIEEIKGNKQTATSECKYGWQQCTDISSKYNECDVNHKWWSYDIPDGKICQKLNETQIAWIDPPTTQSSQPTPVNDGGNQESTPTPPQTLPSIKDLVDKKGTLIVEIPFKGGEYIKYFNDDILRSALIGGTYLSKTNNCNGSCNAGSPAIAIDENKATLTWSRLDRFANDNGGAKVVNYKNIINFQGYNYLNEENINFSRENDFFFQGPISKEATTIELDQYIRILEFTFKKKTGYLYADEVTLTPTSMLNFGKYEVGETIYNVTYKSFFKFNNDQTVRLYFNSINYINLLPPAYKFNLKYACGNNIGESSIQNQEVFVDGLDSIKSIYNIELDCKL